MGSEYRALMRRKLLEEMYDKLSPEDKRLFVQLTMQDKSSEEILARLNDIKRSQQTFLEDFASNLSANATWDAIVWLGSRLLRRIKI